MAICSGHVFQLYLYYLKGLIVFWTILNTTLKRTQKFASDILKHHHWHRRHVEISGQPCLSIWLHFPFNATLDQAWTTLSFTLGSAIIATLPFCHKSGMLKCAWPTEFGRIRQRQGQNRLILPSAILDPGHLCSIGTHLSDHERSKYSQKPCFYLYLFWLLSRLFQDQRSACFCIRPRADRGPEGIVLQSYLGACTE